MSSVFETGLPQTPANFQPLTPLTFLERSASVFPEYPAIVHGKQVTTYASFYGRARQLASALSKRGIGKGDTVSVMLSNTPPMLEAHYGVPMIGAVLHSINTRLDAATVAFQLDHGESKIIIVDREFSPVLAEALRLADNDPLVVELQLCPNLGQL